MGGRHPRKGEPGFKPNRNAGKYYIPKGQPGFKSQAGRKKPRKSQAGKSQAGKSKAGTYIRKGQPGWKSRTGRYIRKGLPGHRPRPKKGEPGWKPRNSTRKPRKKTVVAILKVRVSAMRYRQRKKFPNAGPTIDVDGFYGLPKNNGIGQEEYDLRLAASLYRKPFSDEEIVELCRLENAVTQADLGDGEGGRAHVVKVGELAAALGGLELSDDNADLADLAADVAADLAAEEDGDGLVDVSGLANALGGLRLDGPKAPRDGLEVEFARALRLLD